MNAVTYNFMVRFCFLFTYGWFKVNFLSGKLINFLFEMKYMWYTRITLVVYRY